jgi:hypothetical protein
MHDTTGMSDGPSVVTWFVVKRSGEIDFMHANKKEEKTGPLDCLHLTRPGFRYVQKGVGTSLLGLSAQEGDEGVKRKEELETR